MKTIRQVDKTDCGPTCIAMVLSHWGREEPIYKLRDLCGTSQAGTNFLNMKNAAENLGMEVGAYQADIDGLHEVDLPAILHWEHNHYVVLSQLKKTHAIIADPAEGKRKISLEELQEKWTGKVMQLRPGIRFERAKHVGKRGIPGLLSHLTHFRGVQRILLEIVLVTIILSLFSLVAPLTTQVLFDRVLAFGERQLLPFILAAILVLTILQTFFGALRAYLSTHLAMSLNYRMQMGLLDHMLHLPMRIHETRLVGDFLQRFGDLAQVRSVLTSLMVNVPTALFTLIISAIMLTFYNPMLALVSSLALVLDVVYLYIVVPQLRESNRKLLKKSGELNSFMIGNLEGISALKAYRAEDWAIFKGRNQVSSVMDQSWQTFSIENNSSVIFGALGGLASLITLLYGATQVLDQNMSLGMLIAAYGIVNNAVGSLSSLIGTIQSMQQGSVSSDRLAELLELPREDQRDIAGNDGSGKGNASGERESQDFKNVDERFETQMPPLAYGLEAHNLAFGYLPNRPILQDVSFTIERGQYVALLGRNGSGKSTLSSLLTAMLQPNEGDVLWDGQSLSEYSPASVRERIAYQRQEVPIFYTSMMENLCMGRELPPERIKGVIQALELSEVIRRLPEGIQTVIGGDSPHRLSSGERQLVGVARVLLSDADLLILDEPTATLDMEREAKVVNILTRLKGHRTILVITHRPALIGPADHVLEIEDGRMNQSSSTLATLPIFLGMDGLEQ